MKISQKRFAFGCLVLLVAIIVIGGYVFYQTHKSTQEYLTSLEKNNETSTWKTYRDERHMFEVKDPQEYVVYKYLAPCQSSWDDTNGQNVVIWSKDFLESHNISTTKISDFDIFINDPEDKCVSAHYSLHVEAGTKGYKLVDSKSMTLNGYPILKREYIDTDVPQQGKTLSFSTYRFQKAGNYFTLLYNNGVTLDPEKGMELFEDFLATFKFTN